MPELPDNLYELRDMTTFEKFLNTLDTVNANELATEVYIPITLLSP